MIKHRMSPEDVSFIHSFESGLVSPADFNHRAHLRLAYAYLCSHPFEAAYQKMRNAIRAFLNHHEIAASKYHETLTKAWLLAVQHFHDEG